jgi:hypothetical protein
MLSAIVITLSFIIMSGQQTGPVYPDFHDTTISEIRENTNWEIIAETKGNLDADSKEDMVIILQSKDSVAEKRCETCEQKTQKVRILLVLLRKDNVLKVVVQNNVFIARMDEGGMTKEMVPEISINDNQLNLSYLLVRGERHYIFEKQDRDIVLIKATTLSTSHYIYRSEVVDFRQRTLVTESRSDKDEPIKTKTTKLTTVKELKKLSELGMMETWDVGGVFF